MMSLLAQLLGQQASESEVSPGGEFLVCTISGAENSIVNGNYYTDSFNQNTIAKHVSRDLWIRISQIHMGEPFFNYYSYVISSSTSGGTNYYEWYCTDSLNAGIGKIRPLGSGTGNNTVCTRSSLVKAVAYHAGTSAVNGVYLTRNQNIAYARHAMTDIYLCNVMGTPDYIAISPNDLGTSPYYSWVMADTLPLTSNVVNGASPAAIIYN